MPSSYSALMVGAALILFLGCALPLLFRQAATRPQRRGAGAGGAAADPLRLSAGSAEAAARTTLPASGGDRCFADPERVGAGPWSCVWRTAGQHAAPACCCRKRRRGGDEGVWRCMPTVVQIGAQKAGSTALVAYLLQHPDYRHTNRKETHHFDRLRTYKRGLKMYLRNFPDEQGVLLSHTPTVIGESTPSYAVGALTPRRVHALLPEARIVFMVRNPVDRALSEYKMALRRQHTQDAVAQWLKERIVPFAACVVDLRSSQFKKTPPSDWLTDVLPTNLRRKFRAERPAPVQPLPRRRARDRTSARRKTTLDSCVPNELLETSPMTQLLRRLSKLRRRKINAVVRCLAEDSRLWRVDTDASPGLDADGNSTTSKDGGGDDVSFASPVDDEDEVDSNDDYDEYDDGDDGGDGGGGDYDDDYDDYYYYDEAHHMLTCLRKHVHPRTLNEKIRVPGGMRAAFTAEMQMADRCRDPVSGVIAIHDRENDCFVGAGKSRVTTDYIYRGLYAQQLRRWYEFFKRERVFVAFQEDLKRNGTGVLHELAAFLGLAEHAWQPMDRRAVSTAIQNHFPNFEKTTGWAIGGRKMPDMDPALRLEMDAFFKPHNEDLRELLGGRALPPSWSGE